ncbi:MAG TPA: helix-turn-helix domain-containing protein [Mycobacteriales bacterium]|jgi:DNA-binding HxlR family transcriptional regulator|nr:helix-turn-helix domain-containing protein [Mycobacteriales bacterium]
MGISGPRPCSAAATLEVVGERWSLLVVRELAYGVRRFEGIQRATGAPRNMLATRLRTLEQAGVLERRAYCEHPPRYDYVLTAAGRELVPVLMALQAWGDTFLGGRTTMPLRHRDAHGDDHRLRPEMVCTTCDQPIDSADVALGIADPWAQPAAPTPAAAERG